LITKIHLKNFRGIESAAIDIAPITVLTGANNSGKSSVMYGLLVLKNLVANPNQPLDSFFNFIFMNLGGFKESVHLKADESRKIGLLIETSSGEVRSTFGIELGKSQSRLVTKVYKPFSLALGVDVTFPYALNQSTGADLEKGYAPAKVTWNGLTATVSVDATLPEAGETTVNTKSVTEEVTTAINGPLADLKSVDFIPVRRGFTKPLFSPVPLQAQMLISEDEIATYVANDRDLEGAISFYLERILDKNFQVRPTLGTANFFLQTSDRNTGFVCDLVNDGFGTNTLVYLLAKALRKQQSLICIEEPEIHIHPSALIRLIRVLVRIARETDRKFILSTHSEHLVVELLNSVAKGDITKDEVCIYYLTKDKSKTLVERQEITAKGQIEGGLKAFYQTELEQMRDFIRVHEG